MHYIFVSNFNLSHYIVDTIGPIALPTGALTSQTFEGEAGVASGFGITADGKKKNKVWL